MAAKSPLAVFTFVLVTSVFVGFVAELGRLEPPRALVKADGWQTVGSFPQLKDKLQPLQVPPELADDPNFVAWRNWTPEGSTKGAVTSAPFQAPEFIAVPYAKGGMRGYNQADEVLIQCIDSGATLTVSSAQTFDQFVVAYLKIPRDFCSSFVRLVAVSRSMSRDTYLGIATPFSVSRAVYYAHAGFGAKGLVVLATWIAICLILLAVCCINAMSGARFDSLGVGIIGIGVTGMLVFVGGTVAAPISMVVAASLVLASLLIVVWTFAKRRFVLNALVAELRLPLFCWLALAMFLVAFLSAADNGGGWWSANALFSPLSWSVDNQLPILFAEHFVRHHPIDAGIAGGWLFDDRTPLLTVLLIIPQTLFINPLSHLFGVDFIYAGDSVAAVTILSMWMPVVVWLTTKIRVSSPVLFLAIVSISPFVLFNTLYTWGKILGAAYIIIAVGLMLSAGPDKAAQRPNLMLIPAALTLGFLAHSGNAIGAAAFFIVFAPTLRMRDFRTLVMGTVIALILIAPWMYWTEFVQPRGNALMRLQLANDPGFDHRSKSVLLSTIEALRTMGLSNWIAMKRESFELLVDICGKIANFGPPYATQNPGIVGKQRTLDFVVVARTIGIASFGVLGIIFSALFRRSPSVDPFAIRLAICGLLGLIMMTLLVIPIGVAHNHAYASLMMLSIAGAMFLTEIQSRAVTGAFVLWLVYFIIVWIVDPLRNTDHLHPVTLAAAAAWLLALVWTIVSSRDALSATHVNTILWKGAAAAPLNGGIQKEQ
jgi:hypothetical protein